MSTLKVLSRKIYAHRMANSPAISIHYSGEFSLNRALVDFLQVKEGDHLLIVDYDDDYYLAKPTKSQLQDAFPLRNRTAAVGSMRFRCCALADYIIKEKNLCIAEDRRKSIAFEIDTTGLHDQNMTLYQIKI